MFLKRLFYASASILMLVLAYHLGATGATAQATGNQVVGVAADAQYHATYFVVTANGDTYVTGDEGQSWNRRSSVFGGPTPAQRETFGALKNRYRPPGAAQPTQDR